MKTATVAVEDWIVDVLRAAKIDGRVLKLNGQLKPAEYRKVNAVLEGMGGKWNRRSGGHVFNFDPAGPVNDAIANGRFVHRQKTLQMFETPIEVAKNMAALAGIKPGQQVLEPSAGLGRLCKAAIARGAKVAAVEIDPINADELMKIDGVTVWNGDFLRWCTQHQGKRFDHVLMNPPFTGGQDIAHIMAAWPFVKIGGVLVSIVSESAFIATAWQAREFRTWLSRLDDCQVEKLEPGVFRESGTDVRTRLIVATRE